jgi:phosphohistidine phosphatase
MHELILLRHAEAQAGSEDDDVARPLTAHGEQEARAAGQWLASNGVSPDRILCSPAQRTRQTAALALGSINVGAPDYLEEIYEASPGDLMALLDQHADAEQVLLVGHNPGIERLVALLVEGRSDDFRGMPPGGLARLKLSGPLEPGNAVLEAFWSP